MKENKDQKIFVTFDEKSILYYEYPDMILWTRNLTSKDC